MSISNSVKMVGLLLLTVLSLLATQGTAQASDSCVFPRRLQTADNGPWLADVRNQNLDDDHSKVYISESVIESLGKQEMSTFNLTCVSQSGSNYVVQLSAKYISEGQVLYQCIKFAEQDGLGLVYHSKIFYNPNEECLTYDKPHIMFRSLHTETPSVPKMCPLKGGYLMQWNSDSFCDIFYENSCPGVNQPMRMEFLDTDCIPTQLNMSTVQDLQCVGSFIYDSYTFMLLQHPTNNLVWLMRYHVMHPTLLYIFNDIEINTEMFHSKGVHVSLKKPHLDNMCTDLFNECPSKSPPCSPRWAQLCPVTCGLCNTSSTSVCTFDESVRGSWWKYAPDGNRTLGISANNLKEAGFEGTCYDVSTDHQATYAIHYPSILECKPYIQCLRFRKVSETVTQYQSGRRYVWPTMYDPSKALCNHDDFSESAVTEALLVKSRLDDMTSGVSCFTDGAYYTITGQNSSGTLRHCKTPGIMKLRENYGGVKKVQSFLCLATFNYSHSNEFIVTKDLDTGAIHCWIFANNEQNRLWKVSMEYCSKETALALQNGLKTTEPLESYTLNEGPRACKQPVEATTRTRPENIASIELNFSPTSVTVNVSYSVVTIFLLLLLTFVNY